MKKEELIKEGLEVLFDFAAETAKATAKNFFDFSEKAEAQFKRERKEIIDRFKTRLKELTVKIWESEEE